MNVFVLCTGRCGSVTFDKACSHIRNYTSAHESRSDKIGESRLQYPDNHIEADNRLSWFLGRLDQKYGDSAFYVHLTRDRMQTAKSYAKRTTSGLIINAYANGILLERKQDFDMLNVCLDYCDTVNTNIEAFLKDKTNKMNFSLENAKEDFGIFWQRIGAEGNLTAALDEWERAYNTSDRPLNKVTTKPVSTRLAEKAVRLVTKFPSYLRNA